MKNKRKQVKEIGKRLFIHSWNSFDHGTNEGLNNVFNGIALIYILFHQS